MRGTLRSYYVESRGVGKKSNREPGSVETSCGSSGRALLRQHSGWKRGRGSLTTGLYFKESTSLRQTGLYGVVRPELKG